MKPQAQIEYKPLSELKELPGNPRTIKKDQFEKLKKSLQDNPDYFEARPIILSDRTGENVILAGNQRYKAAKALKMEQVPTITLHGLTEEREREIIIRDNVNNGDWNVNMLANEWNPDELIESDQPKSAENQGGGMIQEHYEQERRPDGSLALFRWTDLDRKTLGKKKLDEIINRWREDVKRGGPDGK